MAGELLLNDFFEGGAIGLVVLVGDGAEVAVVAVGEDGAGD